MAWLLIPLLAAACPAVGQDRPPYVDVPVGNGVVRYVPEATPPVVTPRTRPAPVPDPLPVTLPPLARKVAPATGNRGDGVVNRGLRSAAWTLADVEVYGYEQNIAVEDFAGPVTLAGVRSVNAYRGKAADVYKGQGLYLDKCGPVAVAGCLFGWNGWQADKPANNRTGYRHGIYQNTKSGPLDVSDTILVGNPGAGVQIRAGGTIRRCVIVGNGLGVLAVRGDVLLEDCVFVGGAPYANVGDDGKVKSASGNSAVYAYTDVTMRDCLVLGTPGQGDPVAWAPRTYQNGPLVTDRNHRDNPGKAGRIVCENVVVRGWPDRSPGFAAPDVVGATFVPGPVAYEPRPVIDLYLANKIAGADACARIRSEARAAAGR